LLFWVFLFAIWLIVNACAHASLELLPVRKRTMRCRHCHLTLDREDLGEGYCPECLERFGKKHYDFEELESAGSPSVRYRCEDCGAII
jgi:hypothetical protein